jgi:hypothetical protein
MDQIGSMGVCVAIDFSRGPNRLGRNVGSGSSEVPFLARLAARDREREISGNTSGRCSIGATCFGMLQGSRRWGFGFPGGARRFEHPRSRRQQRDRLGRRRPVAQTDE